jgi:hypothetical protein
MKLNINPEQSSAYLKLGITKERAIELTNKTAEVAATFAAHNIPLLRTIIKSILEEGTEEGKEDMRRLLGDKSLDYYSSKLNLLKETAEICDNLEEYTYVVPLVLRTWGDDNINGQQEMISRIIRDMAQKN